MSKKFQKIVLTGAAGRLGSYLREPLTAMADQVVSTDLVEDIGKLYPGEHYIKADLSKLDEISAVVEGADQIVHFGAIGDEAPWDDILQSNIIGGYNVWEAAHQQGVKRVVYASSIHAVGMHSIHDFVGTDAPHAPDTFYGLAKCFCEDLGRMYWEKRGIESVHLRIYSAAEPNGARSLGAWLSMDDLVQLVQRSVETPIVGFTVIYGVSNNDRVRVDNSKASFLGYRPKDNAEDWADELLAKEESQDPHDPMHNKLGGVFAKIPLGMSGLQFMNVKDDKKST